MSDRTWRFVHYRCDRDDVPLSETFTGAAAAAVDFAATLPRREDCDLLIVADPPSAEVDLPPEWVLREVRERHDARGWDIVVDAHDHGGWYLNTRSAVGYILQRRIGKVLGIRIVAKNGTVLQLIVQDRRDALPMFPKSS